MAETRSSSARPARSVGAAPLPASGCVTGAPPSMDGLSVAHDLLSEGARNSGDVQPV
jgi:hypothetical protein